MLGLEDYGSDSDNDRPKSLVSRTPQPAKKTQRPPKKFAIALPPVKASSPVDECEDIERPMKRQKIAVGASSLLSMLPTPKQAMPSLPTQRVLGGSSANGLTFAFRAQSATAVKDEGDPAAVVQGQTADAQGQSIATLFRPPSLAKGKKNVSVEEPGINRSAITSKQKSLPAPTVDFFSLGEADILFCLILPYDL
jgi:proline-rich protein PRCC